MEQERETREQTAWNIVSQHSGMVLEQLQIAGRCYAEGFEDKWFWALSATRELINHDFKPDEVKELDKSEEFIKKGMRYWKKNQNILINGEKPSKDLQKNVLTFTKKIMEYQRRLMQLLKLQGYFPKKKSREELNF